MARELGEDVAAFPYPRIEDGVHTMAFIEACLASQASGRWVDVAQPEAVARRADATLNRSCPTLPRPAHAARTDLGRLWPSVRTGLGVLVSVRRSGGAGARSQRRSRR